MMTAGTQIPMALALRLPQPWHAVPEFETMYMSRETSQVEFTFYDWVHAGSLDTNHRLYDYFRNGEVGPDEWVQMFHLKHDGSGYVGYVHAKGMKKDVAELPHVPELRQAMTQLKVEEIIRRMSMSTQEGREGRSVPRILLIEDRHENK
jgi:hypothetical protein